MKLTTFIKRPIFSSVISVLILLVGILALVSLPIERYPSIAPPRIQVTSIYAGASAETIIKTVITPLEDAINGVENMLYLNSSASNSGEVTIDVIFKQGSNPDMAAVNVQNRVQKVMSQLPAEVRQYGVSVEKVENSILQIFSVYSPDDTYDFQFLSNYATLNIKPQMMQINGIGKFQMLGSNYSMRIWMDPFAMQQHSLVPNDIMAALATQNIEAATGSIGANSSETYQYTMKYTGRLKTIDEFENIIIKTGKSGDILRLRDVAKVELGTEFYNFVGETNGHPGVMCIAYQQSGSNATLVNETISEKLKEIQENAPSGIEITSLMNTNDFLYSAIEQVVDTLRDAIILVILIVLLFLKDFRSTVIPFISIIVSLIGTFAFMMIAGFSINLLTLFALVLVIGTVVDDSIVVVEAVHAKFDEGVTSAFKATKEAVGEVTKPVLTSSLVFMAVFIPVSFMKGTSGIFYKQFGLTMAVAVGISALNALTLVPALCAMLLKPIKKLAPGEKGTIMERYARWFDNFFDRMGSKYKKGLSKFIGRKFIIWVVSLGGFAALVFFMGVMPSGLVPNEDQGMLIVEVGLPAGSSLHTTSELTKKFSEKLKSIEGIADMNMTSGWGFIAGSNPSAAACIIKLAPWDERSGESSITNIMKNIYAAASDFPEANFTVFSLPMIPGYGTTNDIEMYVQDRKGGELSELMAATTDLINEMGKKGLAGYMAFNMDYPQWEVKVDVAKCLRAGLTPQEVLSVLGSYYGGTYNTQFNLFSMVYHVIMMGDPSTRRDESSLNKTYVRTASGEMSPLTNFVTIRRVFGPDVIKTFNKFTAINVNVSSSMSTGEAITALKECAKTSLPEGYTIDFAGMAREQSQQGSLGTVLLLCIFIIFLILAALYESVILPFAVLLAVPLGLAGSYAASYFAGLDNNIYLQTGVIMLIGLLAKTAILITEYAVDRRKEGMDIKEAAVDAAGARLRAILMTAGCMIIGLFPLIASVGGVGGMGNFSLGLGTVVGMIIGTIGLLYITPVMYTTFQSIQEKIKKQDNEEDEDDD